MGPHKRQCPIQVKRRRERFLRCFHQYSLFVIRPVLPAVRFWPMVDIAGLSEKGPKQSLPLAAADVQERTKGIGQLSSPSLPIRANASPNAELCAPAASRNRQISLDYDALPGTGLAGSEPGKLIIPSFFIFRRMPATKFSPSSNLAIWFGSWW